jgi:hypothetical protein
MNRVPDVLCLDDPKAPHQDPVKARLQKAEANMLRRKLQVDNIRKEIIIIDMLMIVQQNSFSGALPNNVRKHSFSDRSIIIRRAPKLVQVSCSSFGHFYYFEYYFGISLRNFVSGFFGILCRNFMSEF